MTRRLALSAFALVLFATPLLAAKRRAIQPGNPNHCVHALLSDPASPVIIEIEGNFVYWVDDQEGTLRRVPKTGGVTEELAVFEEFIPIAMAVGDTHVYIGALPFSAIFTPQPGVILEVPKSGGVLSVLASGVLTPFDVEVDATHVYWAATGLLDVEEGTVSGGGKIERIAKNGTGRQALAENLSAPLDLTFDGNNVFYGETGLDNGDDTVGLYRVAKTGGTIATIDDETATAYIDVVGDQVVVWGGNATLDNALFVIAKDGSSSRTLVEEAFLSSGGRVAGNRVFYLTDEEDEGATLWSVPIAGGTPVRVREGLTFTDDFEVDTCAATFGTADGQLVSEGV